jgi:hypothetical protein
LRRLHLTRSVMKRWNVLGVETRRDYTNITVALRAMESLPANHRGLGRTNAALRFRASWLEAYRRHGHRWPQTTPQRLPLWDAKSAIFLFSCQLPLPGRGGGPSLAMTSTFGATAPLRRPLPHRIFPAAANRSRCCGRAVSTVPEKARLESWQCFRADGQIWRAAMTKPAAGPVRTPSRQI